MKRVLFVDHVDRVMGGAEFNLIELLTRSPLAHEWHVACACPEHSPVFEALTKKGIECFPYRIPEALGEARFVNRRFPLLKSWQWSKAMKDAGWQLQAAITHYKPRAVVTCTNKDHFVAGPACQHLQVPHVWWVNDAMTPDFFSWLPRTAFGWRAKKHASRLVAVSGYCREALVKLGMDPALVSIVHNGIPPLSIDPNRSGTLREIFCIKHDELLVGTAGRFTPWKGQELFIQLADKWVKSGRPGHFVLIGRAFNEEQAFEEKLHQQVAALGLRNRVHFVSFQTNLPATLMEFDVFMHTSLRPEPFGRVILEAMQAGVPVIAAQSGGVPEIINQGEHGLLAQPGSLQDYYCQLEKLADSPRERQRLSYAARQRVGKHFTMDRVSQQFDQLLNELTSQSSS